MLGRLWPGWARSSNTAISLVLFLLVACGGTTIRVASPDSTGPIDMTGLSAAERQLVERAPAAARAAGCAEVKTTQPYPNGLDRAHVGTADVPTPPPLGSYPSTPPASGPHNPVPLASGVYAVAPDVYRTIHSLEHAAAIVWFDASVLLSAPQAHEFAALTDFFSGPEEIDHVIVAPYAYPDQGPSGRLPPGTAMALVAWHRVQLCQRVSLPAAFAFVLGYRFDPAAPDRYEGEAPETGVPIG